MSRNRNLKPTQQDSTEIKERLTAVLPKSRRKAPGTRLGMLQDWREGSTKVGQKSVGIGKTLRDGR